MKKNLLPIAGISMMLAMLFWSCSKNNELHQNKSLTSQEAELNELKTFFSELNGLSYDNVEFTNGMFTDKSTGVTQDTATLKEILKQKIEEKKQKQVIDQLNVIKRK